MAKSDSQIYTYSETDFHLKEKLNNNDITSTADGVRWINFHSFDNTELIETTFDTFKIHKLTREDIVQLVERPKVEEYDDYIYITLKSMGNNTNGKMISEQISFVLTENNLISYQERHGDMFAYVRDRIETNKGLVRKRGADYLLYLLIEATLVGYDEMIAAVDFQIQKINKELKVQHSPEAYNEIEKCKEKLREIKRAIHPFRDQISKLINSEHTIIKEKTIPFYNDVRDNILYVSDELDNSKNELESLTNLYFARLSQRSNEVMQFLTIVAAIFIPLTFIAGVYGMNFQNMPELKSQNGYFFILGLMLLVAVALIIYFKKRKWF